LDAPTYPAQLVFEQPVGVPSTLTLETFSLAELMAIPDAWAIILKHAPAVRFIVGAQQAKPHLGNMTLASLARHLPDLTPALYAQINGELARLPASL